MRRVGFLQRSAPSYFPSCIWKLAVSDEGQYAVAYVLRSLIGARRSSFAAMTRGFARFCHCVFTLWPVAQSVWQLDVIKDQPRFRADLEATFQDLNIIPNSALLGLSCSNPLHNILHRNPIFLRAFLQQPSLFIRPIEPALIKTLVFFGLYRVFYRLSRFLTCLFNGGYNTKNWVCFYIVCDYRTHIFTHNLRL